MESFSFLGRFFCFFGRKENQPSSKQFTRQFFRKITESFRDALLEMMILKVVLCEKALQKRFYRA